MAGCHRNVSKNNNIKDTLFNTFCKHFLEIALKNNKHKTDSDLTLITLQQTLKKNREIEM